MSIESLLSRYRLSARAEGLSEKTISHTRLAMKLFAQFAGGIADVGQITADDLRRFIVGLQQTTKWRGLPQSNGKKLSGTSINTYARGVKAFFSWLKREGIIRNDPLADVPAPRIPERLPKVLPEDELLAVFRAARDNPRDRAILEVLLDSGMRLGELTGLNLDDVDTDTGVIKVFGKGNKERHVFITGETALTISCYIGDDRPEPVAGDKLFLTIDGHPLTNSRVQKILERIGEKAGISQRLSPHKLRHSYATLSLKHGANLEHVRRTLGHTDIKTTQVYLSLSDADVAEAHRRFSPVANLGLRKAGTQPKRTAPEKPVRYVNRVVMPEDEERLRHLEKKLFGI